MGGEGSLVLVNRRWMESMPPCWSRVYCGRTGALDWRRHWMVFYKEGMNMANIGMMNLEKISMHIQEPCCLRSDHCQIQNNSNTDYPNSFGFNVGISAPIYIWWMETVGMAMYWGVCVCEAWSAGMLLGDWWLTESYWFQYFRERGNR